MWYQNSKCWPFQVKYNQFCTQFIDTKVMKVTIWTNWIQEDWKVICGVKQTIKIKHKHKLPKVLTYFNINNIFSLKCSLDKTQQQLSILVIILSRQALYLQPLNLKLIDIELIYAWDSLHLLVWYKRMFLTWMAMCRRCIY